VLAPADAAPAATQATASEQAPASPPATGPAAAAAATAPAGEPTAHAGGGGAAGAVAEQDGKAYPLTGIKVDYKNPHPQQPPVADLLNTEVRLGLAADAAGEAYVAPRAGVPTVTVKLGEIGKDGPRRIFRSGIAAVYGQIVRFFNARGIIGVFVVVDANDIDATDADIRPADRTTLQFIVVTSVVKSVRTVAIGETAEADRVDSPRHAAIRDHSPLKPAASADDAGRQDLLKKDELDAYVLRLNRQAGRRVDVAVSGTNDPGGVNLDYLVSENRPWYAFAQLSNTGTKQTNTWRERFGYVNNQLTGHDDVLSLDYMTAGFAASHAVILSYELPFFSLDRARYKAYGSWNEFTASDVGQNQERFTGDQWTLGNELIVNVFQQRELFVDLVGGVRAQSIRTDNQTTQTHGQGNFVEPYLAVRLDRTTDIATTSGSLTLVGYVTDDRQSSLDGLGRADVSKGPVALQFDFGQSFYLEPLFDTRRFAAGNSTLAHEVYVAARGQWAFNNRLFPQAQDVAGGLFSVRGYPESVAAGDSVIVGSAEYRFHVPRVLAVQPDPSQTPLPWDKNFRLSPQQVYGRPDWDLILRAFLDVGEVVNSSRQSFEKDVTLVGTGVGVELQYRQNLNLRVDWGAALTDIPDEVKAGSNRFHITSTILY
jgi:hemolysin activation/secretion protein